MFSAFSHLLPTVSVKGYACVYIKIHLPKLMMDEDVRCNWRLKELVNLRHTFLGADNFCYSFRKMKTRDDVVQKRGIRRYVYPFIFIYIYRGETEYKFLFRETFFIHSFFIPLSLSEWCHPGRGATGDKMKRTFE